MRSLIIMQLRSIFTLKVNCILFFIFFTFSLLQGLRLKQYFLVYNLPGNSLDYILFSLGGWQNPFVFSSLLIWLLIILICLYISVISITNINNFVEFIINRINKRMNFWFANCISQLLICCILFIMIFIVNLILCAILFKVDWGFSTYSAEFYSNLVQKAVPVHSIIFRITLIFISGLYALCMMLQVVLLLPFKKDSVYIIFVFLAMSMSVIYIYVELPRFFAFFFYPSGTSLLDNTNLLLHALKINVLVISISILVGGIVCRKKEYKA
ncbi:hypothetical protein CN394_14325 [Bacillus anthracis]|nr:hypothetical protein CN394_14325 [Bacillus anthracis]